MTNTIPQFLIAAPCSGSGKTLVCRGLMAALTQCGLTVQPFKCGPDYIDTKFHTTVCRRASVNLDTFMASPEHVRRLYAHYSAGADACIVEGMMGMFDGYERDRGASSEIASLLHLPVILVVDARSAAYSTAALLSGFQHFRPDVRVAGVIFNRVSSVRHVRLLQEACDDLGLPCFGCLPEDHALKQKSRYLGLDFSQMESENSPDCLVQLIGQYIDIPRLLSATMQPFVQGKNPFRENLAGNRHIVVLRNAESFSFLYSEHLDILSRMGSITYLNPEEDDVLPEDTDLLYLPGGYPEKHAVRLSEASHFRSSVCKYIEQGGRALAECGGMIYLSRGICYDEGPAFVPLCGILPFVISCRRAQRNLSLGYRQFHYRGVLLRGHEFHYTQFEGQTQLPASMAQVYDARLQAVSTPVFRYKNLLAGYTHLYWGEVDILQLFD